MKKTGDAQVKKTTTFRNRDNAESQVCKAFVALGKLAGVDVDNGTGPADLDAALIAAAYQSNYDDPHFLGGPFCFNYAVTTADVDERRASWPERSCARVRPENPCFFDYTWQLSNVSYRPEADVLRLRIVANDANLVAFRVFEVGRIVVLVVFRSQSRAPFRASTALEDKPIYAIDSCAMAHRESDHLPVA